MNNEPHDAWSATAIPAITGLAAAAAIFASGGLALIGGLTAMGCLVGGVVISLAERREDGFDRYCRECEEPAECR